MKQVYIKEEYVKSLSSQGFAALVGILLNERSDSQAEDWSCTTPLTIAGVLTGKKPSDSEFQAVSKGFRDLAELGLVEKYKGHYLVDYSGIERTDEKYVCLEEFEVRAILNSEEGVNRCSLLQYFAYLKSTFDFTTKVGNSPLDRYSEESGKSLLTINKYHKVLEKIGVLKIFRFKTVKAPDGLPKHQINVYCSPRDEEAAIRFIKERGKKSGLITA